jgi:hypothetical protein
MASFLQVVSEMSWDTLFLVVGLAFVAVAVVGNISGKISPGKGGRIAAGIVGGALFGGAFLLHNAIHEFEVTDVSVAPVQPPSGACPVKVNLQGIVDAKNSGDVIYYFEFSNGNASATNTAHFEHTGSQLLPGTWEVHQSLNSASVRLHVVAPEPKASKPSLPFSVACEGQSAHDSVPEAPPPGATAAKPAPPSASGAPASGSDIASPVKQVAPTAVDSISFNSVTPTPGTYLKRGGPVAFNIDLTYNLVSADSAILSISTEQIRTSAAGCKGGSGELVDAVELPITRGMHRVQTQLAWSGDTGYATKGRVYGNGYLSFTPMFWASNNGARGERINFFGTYSDWCYQFGS